MDTVLLTGITGFLGGHIAIELLNSGYHVRGSLRNPGTDGERAQAVRQSLEAAGADTSQLEFVTLDLLKDQGWDQAAEGVRYVMHVASPFVTSMPKDPDVLVKPAVAGTERALNAAVKAGVERVVLTSSTVAIVQGRGPGRPARLGPDDWPDPDEGRLSAYALSKNLAERRAWEMAGETGLDLAVINPGFIIGPLLDDDPGTSGAVLQRLLRGDMPMVPRLHMHLVDVRDLARIHVAALSAPEAVNKRHPAAFSTASLKEISAIMTEAAPAYAKKLPSRQAPDFLVRLIALFDGDIRSNLNELGYAPALDASRAANLLGCAPRAAGETIGDMTRSLISRGLV